MGQMNLVHVDGAPNYPANLFLLFLLIAVCIVFVRIVRLASRLWSLRRKKDIFGSASLDIEGFARAALKGLFGREPVMSQGQKLPDMAFIDAKFLFLWETCYGMVKSARRLAVLTVLFSFFVTALGALNICRGLMTEETSGAAAVGAGGRELFTVLAIGLIFSAIFYAFSILFEGTLARRQRDWNYLSARIKAEIASD